MRDEHEEVSAFSRGTSEIPCLAVSVSNKQGKEVSTNQHGATACGYGETRKTHIVITNGGWAVGAATSESRRFNNNRRATTHHVVPMRF